MRKCKSWVRSPISHALHRPLLTLPGVRRRRSLRACDQWGSLSRTRPVRGPPAAPTVLGLSALPAVPTVGAEFKIARGLGRETWWALRPSGPGTWPNPARPLRYRYDFSRQTQRSTHPVTPQGRPCAQAPLLVNPATPTWSGRLSLPSLAAQLQISPESFRVCAPTEEKPRVQTLRPLLTVTSWLCLFPARRSPLRQPCLSFLIWERNRTIIAPVSWCGCVNCWCGFGAIT